MEKPDKYLSAFAVSDPEWKELFENFVYGEVAGDTGSILDEKTRYMAVLATLLGCQGTDLFREMLPDALEAGVTPVQVKEIVYQAVAYLGIGRVYPFLNITNDIMAEKNIVLPLEGQSATTPETRLEKGSQAQVDIFGPGFKEFYKSGPEETRHINRWLADNCFGDYYTRGGLDYKQREMVTFCFLSAQGTEPQLKGHISGNVAVGNNKEFLIAVASGCMPYIGYPRTLNTLRCISEVLDVK